jgi:antitoxin HicB
MKRKEMGFAWPARLEAQRDGHVLVSFRDLPEALTEGDGRADAIVQASDCLEEAIAGRLARGDDIPAPSRARGGEIPVSLSPLFGAKAALQLALRREGLSQRELARRLDCDEREIRRLLDPKHGSKIERISEALGVLGSRLTIHVEPRAA